MLKPIAIYVACIAGIVALLALGILVVQLCWNHALAPATGLHQITFWQAFGITLFFELLLSPTLARKN